VPRNPEASLVIDTQAPVPLQEAEGLLDLSTPRLDLEALAARCAEHLARDAAGMQEGGRILTGKAAVQPDEEERRVRLQIRAEGVQGVAILRVSRYHPHAERIALRVDHEHPLPAP
jgi:hypothetical protein